MKPLRWVLLAAWIGFFVSLLSTTATNLKGNNRSSNLGRRSGITGATVRSTVSKTRRRRRVYHTRPTHVGSAQALRLLRRTMMEIFRQGWWAFYLPKDTETDSEHIAETREILLEVVKVLGWDIDQFSWGDFLIEIHELFEAVIRLDTPIISPGEMPRSRADRIHWMNHTWVPLSRKAELERLAKEYEEGLPAVRHWVKENVPSEDQDVWLAAVKDSHLIESDVAEIFLEVHAFQPARKAVMIHIQAINDGKVERFPRDAVDPHIKRAERIITHPVLKGRLRELKRVLNKLEKEGLRGS